MDDEKIISETEEILDGHEYIKIDKIDENSENEENLDSNVDVCNESAELEKTNVCDETYKNMCCFEIYQIINFMSCNCCNVNTSCYNWCCNFTKYIYEDVYT